MAGRRVLPQLGFVPCSIIAGILFLVIVALAQAIAETHPDAVSDRHHGDEFLSRRAHEGGYRRSGSRHRVDQGGLFGMNLGGEEDDGTFKPGRGRGEDEDVEEVEVVEEIVEVEEDDEGSDDGRDDPRGGIPRRQPPLPMHTMTTIASTSSRRRSRPLTTATTAAAARAISRRATRANSSSTPSFGATSSSRAPRTRRPPRRNAARAALRSDRAPCGCGTRAHTSAGSRRTRRTNQSPSRRALTFRGPAEFYRNERAHR